MTGIEAPMVTPTQDLILEVLAARYRLGETLWPFGKEHARALRELERLGLVTTMNGTIEKTIRVRLTDFGRSLYVIATYAPPKEAAGTSEWAVQLRSDPDGPWVTTLNHWSLGAAPAGRMTQDQLKLTDRADATAYAAWLAQRFGTRQVRVVSHTVGPWEPEN